MYLKTEWVSQSTLSPKFHFPANHTDLALCTCFGGMHWEHGRAIGGKIQQAQNLEITSQK